MNETIPYLGQVLSLLAAVTWASAVILFKKSGETVHPIALNLFKNLLALILFLPTLWISGGTLMRQVPAWEYFLFMLSGVLGIGIGDTLFLKSLNRIGAGLSAIVICLYSPFIIGLSYLWLGEKLAALQAVGALMIIAAVLLTTRVKDTRRIGRTDLLWGILWGVLATAAMAVATEPVPCMCFLVGAGNFDSISQIHAALMDRIYGYGKVVRMNNDMPNTVENRRRFVQFIAQEVQRFHLVPFSREACIEILDEGRRRSNKRDALTTRFRPLIAIIKTAATLAMNEGLQVVERKHVKEAIEKHCKTIQKQILEHYVSERGQLLEINPEGVRLGQIYGLAIINDPYSGEMTGNVLTVKGFLEKRSTRPSDPLKGYYKVTGTAKSEKEKMIADSIAKVRSVILQKHGVDIAQDYFTHIDFAQAYGVDGPSAGVTMAILLCSLIEGKPIRQDVAVTGEINVGVGGVIQVTAVGGLHEKIKAAEAWGFRKVIIPTKNYKHSIDTRDYDIEVVPGETLEDYLKECLIDHDFERLYPDKFGHEES